MSSHPNNRVAVVTGGSRGIGFAASRMLDAQGWKVIGVARKAPADFPGTFHEVDLGSAEATAAFGETLAARGDVGLLLNNVGASMPDTVQTLGWDDIARLFDLNVRPAIQLTQSVLPTMRAERFGRVINITSLVAVGMRYRSVYGAAKAALANLTRGWALELAETGITVNSVAPGPTETELFRANTLPGSEAEQRFLGMVPMRRFAKPDEIAAAVVFLASQGAAYITGQTLAVDGGASLS